MKVLEFCERFMNMGNPSSARDFFYENITIKKYIPFVNKVTLTERLIDIALFERKESIKQGKTVREKTGNIKVDSIVQYILFYRLIIENYTNLEVETEGFFAEYDALVQSGVLDWIIKDIPEKEIKELTMLIDMKKSDVLQNYATPTAFITQQVERFSMLSGVMLKPILEKIEEQLINLDDDKIDKLGKAIEKGFRRIK